MRPTSPTKTDGSEGQGPDHMEARVRALTTKPYELVTKPISVLSAEDRARVLKLIGKAQQAGYERGLEVGLTILAGALEDTGRPITVADLRHAIAHASRRKRVERDDKGQIVAIVEEPA